MRVNQSKNAFELIRLLFRREIKESSHEKFNNAKSIKEIEAITIIDVTDRIVKQGLSKSYITRNNIELSSPKGRINISKTLAEQTMMHGKVICSFEELSADTFVNQVIKYTLLKIKRDSGIDNTIKVRATKTLASFSEVHEIKEIKVKRLIYDNSTIRYKQLIGFSNKYNIENDKDTDKERLFNIFKESLYYYFNQYYGKDCSVKRYEREFTDEPQYERKVKSTNVIVEIKSDKSLFVIDTKAYDCEATKDTIKKNKQLSYVAKYSNELKGTNSDIKAYGCILYVNTDEHKNAFEEMQLITVNGITLAMQVIDLNESWKAVKHRLDKLYKMFIIEQV